MSWFKTAALIAAVILIISLLYIGFRQLPRFTNFLVQTISSRLPGYKAENEQSLKETVESVTRGLNGRYGVATYNFTTGETYEKDGDHQYLAASLYKVWIMGMIYEQIQNKKLRENQLLSIDLEEALEKYDISPDEAQQASGKISATVTDAVEKMITISDNNTALLLTDYVGQVRVNAFLSRIGLDHSTAGDGMPTSTPHDMLQFYRKLYEGKLANETYTDKMIAVLQRQQLNTVIPKYLPPGTTIAHKTGARELFSHDAGIVYTEHGPYAIVLMSESGIPADAEERMSRISEAVYDYYLKDAERRAENDKIIAVVRNAVYGGYALVGIVVLLLTIRLLRNLPSRTKPQSPLHTSHRRLRDERII